MKMQRVACGRGVLPGAVPTFRFLTALILSVLVLTAACESESPSEPDPDPPGSVDGLTLVQVAQGLGSAVALESPPGDDRLFVASQSGEIRIIRDGTVLSAPFLELGDRTRAQGEQGLLGLTFHPEYPTNGRFFVNYTDLSGDTRIVEYRVSSDPDRADPGSAVVLLTVSQPFANHNGGHLAFGPDGMLWVGLGDGGNGGDPQGHGQNVETLLGGLLRLDVGSPGEARIPTDNPFAGQPSEGREELWAWGLRNPWRFSFDHETGLLYVADVGQHTWEEVNVVAADIGGVNYGWAVREGPECFESPGCDSAGFEPPAISYRLGSEGCAVVGGHVYRGPAMPGLHGTYFYSDYCGGWLRSFRYEDGEARDPEEWPVPNVGRVLSLGRDAAGELYLLTQGGEVFRIEEEQD